MTFGVPHEALEQTLEQEARPIVSGEYVEILSTEEARLRQDRVRRTEKLIGGEQR